MSPSVSILIPLYNEQEVFLKLIDRLNSLMNANPQLSIEVTLVDDGSKDATTQLMQALSLADTRYMSVFLSRNFGHQLALSAGLQYCRGNEAVFILDGDLQDPPELLPSFFEKIKEGYEVVYAVREGRKESFLKKAAYHLFYRFFGMITKIKMPVDSGDFSMISRRVANILIQMPEESRFLRGMRTWVGFKQTGIAYERAEREAGKSKYSFSALIRLAYQGIFNFSEFPIKFIKRIGYAALFVSFIYLCYNVYLRFFGDASLLPKGYTSLLFIVIFFSGLQFVSIGLLGEYILRIFFQVKGRPLFIVKEVITDAKADKPNYAVNKKKGDV